MAWAGISTGPRWVFSVAAVVMVNLSRGRVSGAIGRLMEGPPGRRVAVFTSGGPIGFAVKFALHAPARSFLDLNWRIRNCSVTEFVFDRERLTLDAFNGIAHLDGADLRTYR